jgi:hypothetical protein
MHMLVWQLTGLPFHSQSGFQRNEHSESSVVSSSHGIVRVITYRAHSTKCDPRATCRSIMVRLYVTSRPDWISLGRPKAVQAPLMTYVGMTLGTSATPESSTAPPTLLQQTEGQSDRIKNPSFDIAGTRREKTHSSTQHETEPKGWSSGACR